MCLVLN